MNMTGNFSGTVNIIGESSSASYSITSFDAQVNAADTQAVQTNQEIENEYLKNREDLSEILKTDKSEINSMSHPCGSYNNYCFSPTIND